MVTFLAQIILRKRLIYINTPISKEINFANLQPQLLS